MRAWPLAYVLPALALAAGLLLDQEEPGAHALPQPRYDGAAAWSFLQRLVAIGPRYELTPRAAAANLVEAEAKFWGATRVRSLVCRTPDGTTGRSIVAEFPGTGPLAQEQIVVMGHFDTVPDAPGALDDGTAVALLAGLGRALAGRPAGRTIVLAAVDMEEQGLVGSRSLAEEAAREGRLDRVRAAISTEMLGWKDGVPVIHTFPTALDDPPEKRPHAGGLAPRRLVQLTLACGRDAGRPLALGDRWVSPVYQLLFRHFVTPFDSDCGAFCERGVPALFLSDCSFSRFYPQYHRPTDTLAEVDRDKLDESGRALEALVLALASQPGPADGAFARRTATTDYFAIGWRVLPPLALVLTTILSVMPLSLAVRDRDSKRRALVLLAGLLTGVAAIWAPVTAFVLLPLAWSAGPALLSPRRGVRIAAVVVALAPLVATALTIGAAMLSFRRVVAPSADVPALALCAALPVLLALLALLAPAEPPPPPPPVAERPAAP